jgi:hypothetical protein
MVPVPPRTHSRFGSPARPRVPRLGHWVHRGVSPLISYNGVSLRALGHRGLGGAQMRNVEGNLILRRHRSGPCTQRCVRRTRPVEIPAPARGNLAVVATLGLFWTFVQ